MNKVVAYLYLEKDWYMTGILLNVPKITLDVIEMENKHHHNRITQMAAYLTRRESKTVFKDHDKEVQPPRGLTLS